MSITPEGPSSQTTGGEGPENRPSGGAPDQEAPRRRRRSRRGRRRKKPAQGADTTASPTSEQSSGKTDGVAAKADGDDRPRRRRRRRKPPASNPGTPEGNAKAKGQEDRKKSVRKAAGGSAGNKGHVFGALDLGTNNCRLLVAKPHGNSFRIIDAFSRTIRLGAGLSSEENGPGGLTDDAMNRAIDALSVCAQKMKRRGVTLSRCIATEACRTASNGEAFLERVRKETGIELEIITPEREAALAVSGCSPLLDSECDAAMVFDIGGGSTELVWLDLAPMRREGGEPRILTWTSLPFGVVTLAEAYPQMNGKGDVDEADLFAEMVARVRSEIDVFTKADDQRPLFDTSRAHLIGNSGTVTTLAAVHLGLKAYDRRKVDGLWIPGQDLYDLIGHLSEIGLEGRAAIPSVGDDRADLLFPGCAILRAIQDSWPSERIRVADRGLREGILVELMEEAAKDQRKGRTRRGRRGGRRRQGGAKSETRNAGGIA